MSEIVYRRAETDDAEAIYVFGRQLLSETSLMLLYPDERAKSVDDMRFVIQRFHEMPRFLVNAWDGDICVGEALCMGGQLSETNTPAGSASGVLASQYSKGVGKGLMQEIERVAKENDISRLDLTVMSHNERPTVSTCRWAITTRA